MMGEPSHRQWPPPKGPWVMRMVWRDLLFAHWAVDAEALRPHVPAGLEIGTFDGRAWLAVTPFRMSGVRPRCMPPAPGVSAFEELNVRTYVTAGGKPGVWFFNLDAASRLAVVAARWSYRLNYQHARMRCRRDGQWIEYESERRVRPATHPTPAVSVRHDPPRFRGRYRPVGEVFRAPPGSLESWLTDRYCLYAADREGRLFRAEIDHEPWPLQRAEAHIAENTMTRPIGVDLPASDPHLLFSRDLEVVAWWPESRFDL